MTAITLHMEDSLVTRLTRKAKDIGINIDSYIVYQLNRIAPEEDSVDNVDALLKDMRLPGNRVPTDETGKGVMASQKYM